MPIADTPSSERTVYFPCEPVNEMPFGFGKRHQDEVPVTAPAAETTGASVDRHPSVSNHAIQPDTDVEESTTIPQQVDHTTPEPAPVFPNEKESLAVEQLEEPHQPEPEPHQNVAMPVPVVAQEEAPPATSSSVSRNPSILKKSTPPPLPPRSTSPSQPVSPVSPSVKYADADVQGHEATSVPGSLAKRDMHTRAGSVLTSGAASTHTRGGSVHTTHDGTGTAFSNGAGTVGPNATPLESHDAAERTGVAEAALTPKEMAKITKAEIKDGKRLSKIIKQESKIEKKAVEATVKELGELQKIQKTAVKREAKAHSAHTKSLTVFQKHEAAFNAARTKYEAAQAQLNSIAETLENTRGNARDATEAMQEKMREVENLRTNMAVDERERGAKLATLSGRKSLG